MTRLTLSQQGEPAIMTAGARLLKVQHDFMLYPKPPFHFEGTVHKPSHFPSSDNLYEDNRYWFTFRFNGHDLGVRLSNAGSIDSPTVETAIFSTHRLSQNQLSRVGTEIEYRFDMRTDLTEFYDTCGHDAVLQPVIERWRGTRVSNSTSLYEFLVIATVLQNTTVRRSVQMIENLFQHYGSTVRFDNRTLSMFWPPESIVEASEEELRTLKLGYRAKMFKRQAVAFVSEEYNESELRLLPSDELRIKLLQLYGIGPASVWYLLFEVFKRYDAFEYISPWEQKIYSHILFDKELVDSSAILKEVDRRWGKWKMLASHYLFEDLFWQRKHTSIPWLEELIRL